jgi:hypothetical protein
MSTAWLVRSSLYFPIADIGDRRDRVDMSRWAAIVSASGSSRPTPGAGDAEVAASKRTFVPCGRTYP